MSLFTNLSYESSSLDTVGPESLRQLDVKVSVEYLVIWRVRFSIGTKHVILCYDNS
jgi:hypothetical protein